MRGAGEARFPAVLTHFNARNTKEEIEEYPPGGLHETSGLHRPLLRRHRTSSRSTCSSAAAVFKVRAALAATASPLWGVYAGYGAVEHAGRPGAEEHRSHNETSSAAPRDFATARCSAASPSPRTSRRPTRSAGTTLALEVDPQVTSRCRAPRTTPSWRSARPRPWTGTACRSRTPWSWWSTPIPTPRARPPCGWTWTPWTCGTRTSTRTAPLGWTTSSRVPAGSGHPQLRAAGPVRGAVYVLSIRRDVK
ncbi:hypothetical protein QJS66_09480 [Kocuria rhizophila]|nr:hypothetical protein QJS66_09480 [Kocuria rhizophila]